MSLNLAKNVSRKAWFAPLAAPIGALPFLFDANNSNFVIDFLWWTVFVAYLYLIVIVMPVFIFTKNRFVWSPLRVILFGPIVAVFPLAIAFAFSPLSSLGKRDWTLFWAMIGAGFSVAVAYTAIQVFYLRSRSNDQEA